jgi:hypothetical protein
MEIAVFIQYIQGKCQRPADLRRLMDEWEAELGPNAVGWLGGTYGFANDTDTFCAVVRFESREAAEQNSARPEQGQWFNEMQKCFVGPVEFKNCDTVMTMLEGGSDTAGFVQIMRGQVLDADKLQGMTRFDDQLRQMRPEIIGGTFAIADDGTYVNTIAFTDEESARRGEQQEMPDDVAADMMAAIGGEVSYLDLREPWFASRS